MRLRIRHVISVLNEPAATGLIGLMRLTPRGHVGQHVVNWTIDLGMDARLRASEDAFGNSLHGFDHSGPLDALRIEAMGEIDLSDQTGFVRDAVERFPAELYLRDSTLALADPALRRFADAAVKSLSDPIARLHALMGAIHDGIAFEHELPPSVAAPETLEAGKGDAASLAHVMIACCRHLGAPARFVSGLALGAERPHAWFEAHVDGLGWIAFDPSRNLCPSDRHVRVAAGLDALACAPLRIARGNWGTQEISSTVEIVQA